MKTKPFFHKYNIVFVLSISLFSCTTKMGKEGDEQISASAEIDTNDSSINSITGNITMKQILTFPSTVILTGQKEHRLISIYKSKPNGNLSEGSNNSTYSYDNDENGDESSQHFMPGIDILFGYNLLNIVHYDLISEKGNYFFSHPVLVKTLYYPSFKQDSVNNKPVNRNYYLVSAYDEDTNKDTLINRKDLRRFYHFDSSSKIKTQIIPADYSTIRSQYDSKNDIMYVFARHDENNNGTQDRIEPIHVFWFSLNAPDKAKLLY